MTIGVAVGQADVVAGEKVVVSGQTDDAVVVTVAGSGQASVVVTVAVIVVVIGSGGVGGSGAQNNSPVLKMGRV